MLTNNAVYAILAVGMTCVLLTGGIDISVGSVLAVSAVSVTNLMVLYPTISPLIWVISGCFIGGLCGFFNGFFIGKLKITPMIVTLASMYIFRALAFVIGGGEWIFTHAYTQSFMNLSQQNIIGFNAIVWWAIAVVLVFAFLFKYVPCMRRMYAVGSNEASAKIAGINISRVKILAYTLCGICTGLAGVLYSANYTMVNSDVGLGYEMTVIAICILGGVSITGGRGEIDGVVIAICLMSVITYLLSLLPGFSVWQMMLQGAIIIVAILINILNTKLTEKHALNERDRLI